MERGLSPHILFIVFDLVATQEFQVFGLEILTLVVGALVLDVVDDGIQPGFAHGEGAVAFLPGKGVQLREGLVNPFGGIALEILRDLIRRQLG